MEPTTGASPPPQPPPPPVAPVKKKTSPWVWILVGCGGLIVVGMILVGVTGAFLFKKGTEKLQEFAENPVREAAETIVRLNPDLELVSSDDEAQTMTVKNLKTGEVATFDWSDIQNGRFSFESDGQEYTLDGSGAADGRLTVEDGSGKEVATFGLGAGEVPSWFPAYADAFEVQVLVNATQNGQESRIWTFKTDNAVSDVLSFYEQELQSQNWDVTSNTSASGQISNGSIDAKADNGARSLNLVISKDGADPAQVMVTYTGPPAG
jgi:hypothetical protein